MENYKILTSSDREVQEDIQTQQTGVIHVPDQPELKKKISKFRRPKQQPKVSTVYYMHTYTHVHTCMCVYVYTERERE